MASFGAVALLLGDVTQVEQRVAGVWLAALDELQVVVLAAYVVDEVVVSGGPVGVLADDAGGAGVDGELVHGGSSGWCRARVKPRCTLRSRSGRNPDQCRAGEA